MTEPTTKITPEDRALRRIRGLLNKADRTTYESEREDFMAKAMQLMAEYGINEAMANAREQTREKIVQKRIDLGNPYSYDKSNLFSWLADVLHCSVVCHKHGKVYLSVTVFGYESDVIRLEMLYTSLLMQVLRQVARVRPAGFTTPAWTREYRANWFHGFNARVVRRVMESEQRAMARFEQEHAGAGTALVITGRRTRVEEFKAEAFPKLDKFRPRDRGGYGMEEGVHAGDRADIGSDKVDSGDQRKIGPNL